MNLISITAEIPEPLYRIATQTVKASRHLTHDRLVAEAIAVYIRLQQEEGGRIDAQH
jgi:hypothetical protein